MHFKICDDTMTCDTMNQYDADDIVFDNHVVELSRIIIYIIRQLNKPLPGTIVYKIMRPEEFPRAII